MANFAKRYARQNQHDFEALLTAVDSGRLSAEPGV